MFSQQRGEINVLFSVRGTCFFLLKYVLDFSNGGPIIPSPPSTIISYQIIFKEGGLQRTWWAAWTLAVAEEREIIGRDGVPFGASGVVWKVIGFSLRPWGIEECLERKGAWTTVYSTLIENEAGWLFLYSTNTFPPGRVFLSWIWWLSSLLALLSSVATAAVIMRRAGQMLPGVLTCSRVKHQPSNVRLTSLSEPQPKVIYLCNYIQTISSIISYLNSFYDNVAFLF